MRKVGEVEEEVMVQEPRLSPACQQLQLHS